MNCGSARKVELKIPTGLYWYIIVLRISDTNLWCPVFIIKESGVPYDGYGCLRVDEKTFVLLAFFTFAIWVNYIPFRFCALRLVKDA